MNDKWQNKNENKANYCERISECSSRNCNKSGNAEYAVIGDDGKEYCSSECADDEKSEVDTRALTTRLLSEASQENCDGPEHDLMIEAYHRITTLEQQLAKHQWIPVSEGLPKISEDIILIRDEVGNFLTAVFDGDYILESGRALPADDDEITHWKPINPPSEVR